MEKEKTNMANRKQLDRRSFLKSAILAGSTTTTSLATPSVIAKSPIVINMQTSWSNSDIWMDLAREYTLRVEEMSGRRITFDLSPAGSTVEAHQVMDAVSEGILDAAHSVPIYWYDKHKAASLFGTGPFWGGSAATMLSWFYQGGGSQLYQELTQEILNLNVYGFLGFPMFAQPFGWFKNKFTSIDELERINYRTTGLAKDLMQLMGMKVMQLPEDEIVNAMEKNIIDAFEYNNPSADKKLGAHRVATNYYLSSFHQTTETFEFLFNKDFYDDLDPELQAIIKYAVEAASTSNTARAMREYSSDLNELKTKHGVSVHRTSKDILKKQLQAWKEIIEDFTKDEFSNRLVQSQRNWVEQVSYFEIMNAPDYGLAYEFFFPDKLNI